MLEAAGEVIWVRDEAMLDAVTAVSGSGPAYFALLAEAMIEAGILLGLPRTVAHDLIVQTALRRRQWLLQQRAGLQIIGADPEGSIYSGGPVHPYLVEGIGDEGLVAPGFELLRGTFSE